MFEFIKFLQKRPKDRTIIIMRIVFGLVLMGVLYYNFFVQEDPNQIVDNMLFGSVQATGFKDIIKYVLIGLGIFPFLFGVTNICVTKKKYIRIAQIVFAFVLFYSAYLIKGTPNLDIDSLLFLMGFLPLFAGITGKCITSKCLKYGEKIKKIRV